MDQLRNLADDRLVNGCVYYRYIAVDDVRALVIRIVIAEFFACEIGWLKN